jgi:hypothetical protein
MNLERIQLLERHAADLSKRLKNPALSDKERGKLIGFRKKLDADLRAAYTETAAATPVAKETLLQGRKAPVVSASKSDRFLDFDFYLFPLSQNAQMFANTIVDRWLEHRTFKRAVKPEVLQAYKRILEGVAMNFLYALATDHAGVMTTRDRGRGVLTSDRYTPEAYTPDRFLSVLDDLQALDYIVQKIGDKWKRDWSKVFGMTQRSYRGLNLAKTKLTPTVRMRELMDTYQVGQSQRDEVGINRERQEVLLLKSGMCSALVDYEDTPTTERYRRQMRIINEMLEEAGDLVAPEFQDRVNDRQRFLERKFLFESFVKGGRLNGGFWQSEIRKEERWTMLRIGGHPTVELDFANMGVRLAYHFIGEVPPIGDLYMIPGLLPESRAGVKILLNALMFPEHELRSFPLDDDGESVAEKFNVEDRAKGFRYILNAIKSAHPAIVDLFGTGVGYHLQFIESQVLVNILLALAKADVVALPLHDAIVVAEPQAEIAKGVIAWITEWGLGQALPVEQKEVLEEPVLV